VRYPTGNGDYGEWQFEPPDPEAWRRVPPATSAPRAVESKVGVFGWLVLGVMALFSPALVIGMLINDALTGGYGPRNLPGPCYYADF
jgi:hypothetical protein